MSRHPDRDDPPASFQGFLLRESPLRSNPQWAAWLDAQSPVLEHVMFGDALMGAYANNITLGTEFAAYYVRINFSEQLADHFRGHVSVRYRDQDRHEAFYNPVAAMTRYHRWHEKLVRDEQRRAAKQQPQEGRLL